jgi:hypothetical protein
MMTTLAGHWHPIALSTDGTGQPSQWAGGRDPLGVLPHRSLTIHLCLTVPARDVAIISLVASPTSDTSTEIFVWLAGNPSMDQAEDAEFADSAHGIMEQDRVFVESEKPEKDHHQSERRAPSQDPDASRISYRRYLGAMEGTTPYMPSSRFLTSPEPFTCQ